MIKRSRVIGVVAVMVGVLAPASVAAASQYVDLGDSYASGVGTRVFYSESGSCQAQPRSVRAEGRGREGLQLRLPGVRGAKTSNVIANQLAR